MKNFNGLSKLFDSVILIPKCFPMIAHNAPTEPQVVYWGSVPDPTGELRALPDPHVPACRPLQFSRCGSALGVFSIKGTSVLHSSRTRATVRETWTPPQCRHVIGRLMMGYDAPNFVCTATHRHAYRHSFSGVFNR
jgi:hypothetical protein